MRDQHCHRSSITAKRAFYCSAERAKEGSDTNVASPAASSLQYLPLSSGLDIGTITLRINAAAKPGVAPKVFSSFDPRVWLLALGTFAVGTDSFVVSGILNQLAHDLAINLDVAGNIASIYSLAYGLSTPFLAALTSRFRKDRVVLTAIAAFAAANTLCAVAPN